MGKQIKNDYIEEYQFRKVVESFFKMQLLTQETLLNGEVDLRSKDFDTFQEVIISNKQDLYDYYINDFSKLFFTPELYVQQQLNIIGPVRFRTIHTETMPCQVPSDLKNCYFQEMNEATIIKKPIDGVNYKTCDEIGEFQDIAGEQAIFPCDGHLIDVFPKNTSAEGFQEQINDHIEMLFGDAARGMNMEMVLYSPRANWFTHV